MHSFLDSASPQRTWEISLNVGTIRRVKNSTIDGGPIDLVEINAGDPPLILRLATDPCLLCDVLYCLCKPAADELNISDAQFGEAMGGDALLAGQQALFEELKDFFQKLGRTEKQNVVVQTERVVKATIEAANKQTAKLDVESLASRAVGKLFTDAQASLESRLSLTPSEN